jgi:DNA modification methylase
MGHIIDVANAPFMNITNEDNMELMARYPDKYFDLAIVDPPYGIGEDKSKNHTKEISKTTRL